MDSYNRFDLTEKYYTLMEEKFKLQGYNGKHKANNLKFYYRQIFDGINFDDKCVLDIGGGDGTISFYAYSQGAASVTCLEPESSGSTNGVIRSFHETKNRLNAKTVVLETCTLQDYSCHDHKFDIVILNNSINHIDEQACTTLLYDKNSRTKYQQFARKIAMYTNNDANLILCDCSRNNFYSIIRVKNPFMREIEWNKHQSPKTWIEIFELEGFTCQDIRWTSFNTLRRCGNLLFGNFLASYFLNSNFCINIKMN